MYFVYNGRIQLTLKKAEKLLPASVSLMLPELTNMCEAFILHQLDNDKSGCIDIHRIAKHNSLEKAAVFLPVFELQAILRSALNDPKTTLNTTRSNYPTYV